MTFLISFPLDWLLLDSRKVSMKLKFYFKYKNSINFLFFYVTKRLYSIDAGSVRIGDSSISWTLRPIIQDRIHHLQDEKKKTGKDQKNMYTYDDLGLVYSGYLIKRKKDNEIIDGDEKKREIYNHKLHEWFFRMLDFTIVFPPLSIVSISICDIWRTFLRTYSSSQRYYEWSDSFPVI